MAWTYMTRGTRMRFFILVLGWAAATVFAGKVAAQTMNYEEILTKAETVTVTFDAAYEAEKARDLRLHFSIDLPVLEGAMIVQTNYDQTDRYGEYRFFNPNQQLAEMVSLFDATIDAGTPEERTQFLANVIEGAVLPGLGTFPQISALGMRVVEVAGQPAVENLSLYVDPSFGQVVLRVVGVFPPDSPHVLIIVSHSVLGTLGVDDVDKLTGTFAGTVAQSVVFQAGRDAEGALITFEAAEN